MARPRKSRLRQKRRNAQRTERNQAARQAPVQQEQRLERARTQPPLERYLARKEIEQYHYEAGTEFYDDWLGSTGAGSLTSSYGQHVPGHQHESAYQIRCYQNYRSALQAVGQYLSPVLIAVCIHDQSASEWASTYRKSGKHGMGILLLALDALAVHYGLVKAETISIVQAERAVLSGQPMLAEVPLTA